MSSDNILDAVDRIEQAIGKFERILYGDTQARQNGLLVEFEGLRKDVQGLRSDVQNLKNRRPSVPMWASGYFLFVVSGMFAIIGFVNLLGRGLIWDLPPVIALSIAGIFVLIALFLFVGGFGWLDGRT